MREAGRRQLSLCEAVHHSALTLLLPGVVSSSFAPPWHRVRLRVPRMSGWFASTLACSSSEDVDPILFALDVLLTEAIAGPAFSRSASCVLKYLADAMNVEIMSKGFPSDPIRREPQRRGMKRLRIVQPEWRRALEVQARMKRISVANLAICTNVPSGSGCRKWLLKSSWLLVCRSRPPCVAHGDGHRRLPSNHCNEVPRLLFGVQVRYIVATWSSVFLGLWPGSCSKAMCSLHRWRP